MVAKGKLNAPGAAGRAATPRAIAFGIESALGSLPCVALFSDRVFVVSLAERSRALDRSMFASRFELEITVGMDRLLSAFEHVTWSDVDNRTVQSLSLIHI